MREYYAIGSGACAAAASIFAKVAFDSAITPSFTIRVLSVLLFALASILMWSVFAKSLTECSSALTVVLCSSATNFLLTGIFGWILFGEKHGIYWWFGSALLVAGICVVGLGAPKEKKI